MLERASKVLQKSGGNAKLLELDNLSVGSDEVMEANEEYASGLRVEGLDGVELASDDEILMKH